MKRLVVIFLSCCLLLGLCGCGVVRLKPDDVVQISYRNEHTGVSFREMLTEQEKVTVVNILNGKPQKFSVFNGVPSCSFDPQVSIIVNGTTFALALDKCGMLQNCNTKQYISISDSERKAIEALFTTRGGTFPCN